MSLFDDFVIASEDIIDDLDIEKSNLIINREDDANIEVYYRAHGFNKQYSFYFDLITHTDNEDPTSGKMELTFQLNYNELSHPYFISEDISYLQNHSEYLRRWVAWAVHRYRLEYEKINLDTLFHGSDIRIYSLPGYSRTTDNEAVILFNGIIQTQKEKLIIYRFRHVSSTYHLRSFSYAVYVRPKGYSSFLVFFPFNCGFDSGGSRLTQTRFQNLINKTRKYLEVEIRKHDIPYIELEKYLYENFNRYYLEYKPPKDFDLNQISHIPKVLENSETAYNVFLENMKLENYPNALRDLRALVQQAQENTLSIKQIQIDEKNKTITKLAPLLIDNTCLDGRLSEWFRAFSSIANLAAHGDYPNPKQMENKVLRKRILLTIKLGLHLIEELNSSLDFS